MEKKISIEKSLDEIEPFMQKLSMFSHSPSEYPLFESLIHSSIIKNYEFLKLVYVDKNFESHFFTTSFLRGIIEDIIILKSIHHLSFETRKKLLTGIHLIEVNERISMQWDFFQKYRPLQPVIDENINIDDVKMDLQALWRENGWPKFEVKSKNLMPPVIQLAQKLAPGILDILYEFTYRLSSSTVHFSPQTLLRMGWGYIDSENILSGSISVNHMEKYHKSFCQIYGALLFTFYFEFFPNELGVGEIENNIIINIRKILLEQARWPEMITFEEMNLSIPKANPFETIANISISQIIMEILQNGFVNNNYEEFLETIKIK